jgi:hypothetical protein
MCGADAGCLAAINYQYLFFWENKQGLFQTTASYYVTKDGVHSKERERDRQIER